MEHDLGIILRRFIADNFLFKDDMDWLTDTTSFRDTGIIDSTGVIELVRFLEATFGIQINDQDMLPENLDCIRAITAFVGRKARPHPIAA